MYQCWLYHAAHVEHCTNLLLFPYFLTEFGEVIQDSSTLLIATHNCITSVQVTRLTKKAEFHCQDICVNGAIRFP